MLWLGRLHVSGELSERSWQIYLFSLAVNAFRLLMGFSQFACSKRMCIRTSSSSALHSGELEIEQKNDVMITASGGPQAAPVPRSIFTAGGGPPTAPLFRNMFSASGGRPIIAIMFAARGGRRASPRAVVVLIFFAVRSVSLTTHTTPAQQDMF